MDLSTARRSAVTVDGFLNYMKNAEAEQAKGTDEMAVNVLTYHVNNEKAIVDDIYKQLNDIDGELLLFLNRAEELIVETDEKSVKITKNNITSESTIMLVINPYHQTFFWYRKNVLFKRLLIIKPIASTPSAMIIETE